MPPVVQQDSASACIFLLPSPRGEPDGRTHPQGMEFTVEDPAQKALLDPVLCLCQDRRMLPVVRRESDSLLLACELQDLVEFSAGAYEGLLAEDVKSLSEGLHHGAGMKRRRGADVHEVEELPSIEIFLAGIGAD